MAKREDYKKRFEIAAKNARWAMTMTKVRIRQAVAQTPFPRWHFVKFAGPGGGESRGVVDLIAIRKDHSSAHDGLKPGDTFQIILIQVKGGYAARPTVEDAIRLRAVARHHHARETLLATWKKGKAARFYSLRPNAISGVGDWVPVSDLKMVFQ